METQTPIHAHVCISMHIGLHLFYVGVNVGPLCEAQELICVGCRREVTTRAEQQRWKHDEKGNEDKTLVNTLHQISYPPIFLSAHFFWLLHFQDPFKGLIPFLGRF